ncbi:hypothetical protein RSSM_03753 [Rhodopirellula sallentina SM41]|uniref:Uncharacterized protein n=1 Tax=Rhodopirellula sallentina SM41 TaxID=1263870 RepID=M5U0P7_9BACT|nr:hypothetical protein RSSM_03753 [Rhodopirellula sallentina SM41]
MLTWRLSSNSLFDQNKAHENEIGRQSRLVFPQAPGATWNRPDVKKRMPACRG